VVQIVAQFWLLYTWELAARGFSKEREDETGEHDKAPGKPDNVRGAPGSPQQAEEVTADQGDEN
jgi:hypothetical protein